MAFNVLVTTDDGTQQYSHAQRKIAERQFNACLKRKGVVALALEHRTKKQDRVLRTWERPAPIWNDEEMQSRHRIPGVMHWQT